MGTILAKRRGVSRSPKVVKLSRAKLGAIVKESHAKSPQRNKLLRNHKRIAEYAKLHGIATTAAKFGYSNSMTRNIATKHGWVRAPLLYDQDAILRDYLAGVPLAVIVEKHGCEQSYAAKLAKRRGKVRNPEFSNINKRKPHKKKAPAG